ncbi:hypothetical protein BU23DRAFT_601610 [Bimuria novae-zelandiae CBS 107.79]|uniref:Uncharacterized protein n=1 Tax=Bimuria novae-zelandiae CBS 107.79 TaxID=1447943 RepID=A0A6A5UW64_9PLEO|nr:hypothetical protein BU23DRAFT_601610 [Bimuria novae-zelandiae CBS 107.79]
MSCPCTLIIFARQPIYIQNLNAHVLQSRTARVPTIKATRGSAHRTKATRKPASKPASQTKKSKIASGNTRKDSLSRRFPGLLPNLLGPPSSSSSPPPSLPPTPPPVPVPAPTPTPTPIPPATTIVAVPSSPPRASSPVPGPLYNLEIKYTLRVNKAIKVKDIAILISVAFRAGWRTKTSRSAFKHKTLADFMESGDVLVRDMDRAAKSLRGCDILEIRVDVKLYNLVTADGGVAGVSMTGRFATRPFVVTINTGAGFLSLLKVNPYTRKGKEDKKEEQEKA